MKKIFFFKFLRATFALRILEEYLWMRGSQEVSEREHLEPPKKGIEWFDLRF